MTTARLRWAAEVGRPRSSASVCVVVVFGIVNAAVHAEGSGLLDGSYGRLVMTKAAIVIAVVGLALGLRRRGRTRGLALDVALLTGAAMIGSVLATMPGRFPFPRPVGPVVLAAGQGPRGATVVLSPGQPGPNRLLVLGGTTPVPSVSLNGTRWRCGPDPEGGRRTWS